MSMIKYLSISEGRRNFLVAAGVFLICLPYVHSINRTADRATIVTHALALLVLVPTLMTVLAHRWRCEVSSLGRESSLRRRLAFEAFAISAALAVFLVVFKALTGKAWGLLLSIHLWTAMLPVYAGFLAVTLAQALRLARAPKLEPQLWLNRIQVSSRGEKVMLGVANIELFASEDHETVVYTSDREYVCDISLTRLMARLDPRLFARTHRSQVVNLSRVTSTSSDGATLHLASGRVALVSKRNRPDTKRALRAMAT